MPRWKRKKTRALPPSAKSISQLLYTYKMARHQAIAPGVATLETSITLDNKGMTLVDIDARNTVVLLKQIAHNGVIVNNFPRLNSIRALVPLTLIPILAASPDVTFIRPADRYHLLGRKIPTLRTRQAGPAPMLFPAVPPAFAPSAFLPAVVREQRLSAFLPPAAREQRLRNALPGLVTRARQSAAYFSLADLPAPTLSSRFLATPAASSLNAAGLSGLTTFAAGFYTRAGSITSEGDATHRADLARSIFQADGTGIKIGVLSDGVSSLATSQSTG